jgi:RNA polymerase Rpb6
VDTNGWGTSQLSTDVDRTQDQQMAPAEEVPEPATGSALVGERLPNAVRVTTPYLTKYERARILGTRALQIRYVFVLFIY